MLGSSSRMKIVARSSLLDAATRRTTSVLLAAAFALIMLAACSGAERSGDVRDGPADGDAIELEARDNEFLPAEVSIPAGEEAAIEIENTGSAVHDFTIEDLDVSSGPIAAGDVVTVTISGITQDTGFRCTLHGGMEGTLVAT